VRRTDNEDRRAKCAPVPNECNLMFDDLAAAKKRLDEDVIRTIPIIQEWTPEKFGKIAIVENYQTEEKVRGLLRAEEDMHLYFGRALVLNGVISEGELIQHLKECGKKELLGLRR